MAKASLMVAVVAVCVAMTPHVAHHVPAQARVWSSSTTQLWSGPDKESVPLGFNGCDTAGWPAQMAPIRQAGETLYLSGILGYDKPCESAHKDPVRLIELAFHFLNQTLYHAKIHWSDLVSVTSYHVDMEQHMDTFFAQRKKYMKKGPYPSWSAVAVPELFYQHEFLEMTAIAHYAP